MEGALISSLGTRAKELRLIWVLRRVTVDGMHTPIRSTATEEKFMFLQDLQTAINCFTI
jgi:hypothetical protein